MNDISAPLSYYPSKAQDHIMVEITIIARIGVNDCEDKESLSSFQKIITERVRTTGMEIEELRVDKIKASPYCGSLREKLLMNEQECQTKRRY